MNSVCAKDYDFTISTELVKERLKAEGYGRKSGKKQIYFKHGCHSIEIIDIFEGIYRLKVNGWMLSEIDLALKRSRAL